MFRGIGSISQLGIISYIGYMAGFKAVGEFSIAYSGLLMASQIMKPGLEYFILSKVKPESKGYNYRLVWLLFLKIVTPIFILISVLVVSIASDFTKVSLIEIVNILLAAYFISAMHMMAEVFKADGQMFWYALSKMAGLNVLLLIYYVLKATIFGLTVEGIDFFLITFLIFLMTSVRFSKNKATAAKIKKTELLIDRQFINYSMAGLILSVVTLGYPLILDYFIDSHELGVIFSLQKFASVLTILSSSVYTASTKSLISKRTVESEFLKTLFKYYVVVLLLCLLYCSLGIAVITYFDVLIEVRNTIYSGSWLVFIPEIIIVLTGPTMHVINILNDHKSLKMISIVQAFCVFLSAATFACMAYFLVELESYHLYLIATFPIICSQFYSLKRMLCLIGIKK